MQAGHNRTSGSFVGNKGLTRLKQWAYDGTSPVLRFTAFGRTSFNSGMAIVPAVLTHGVFQSAGVLAISMFKGKLLEIRWFPDDVQTEDQHFGGEPVPDGPSPAEKAFEQAAVTSKTLRKAPDNESLLALYSLYKQGSIGDCSGPRPSVMDMVGRAKYDAWMARKGMSTAQAMSDYVALVGKLKADDAA
jgi:carboxylesterase